MGLAGVRVIAPAARDRAREFAQDQLVQHEAWPPHPGSQMARRKLRLAHAPVIPASAQLLAALPVAILEMDHSMGRLLGQLRGEPLQGGRARLQRPVHSSITPGAVPLQRRTATDDLERAVELLALTTYR